MMEELANKKKFKKKFHRKNLFVRYFSLKNKSPKKDDCVSQKNIPQKMMTVYVTVFVTVYVDACFSVFSRFGDVFATKLVGYGPDFLVL